MRRVPCLAFLLAACIPPPPDLCQRGVDLECDRQFECQSDAVKSTEAFLNGYGATAADCKQKVAVLAGCADKRTEDELCIGENAGKKFQLWKASDCSDQRKALTCADFLDPAKTPAVCSEQCL